MRKYETPELKTVRYDVNNKIMDGYNDGDLTPNPYEELFQQGSEEDTVAAMNAFHA